MRAARQTSVELRARTTQCGLSSHGQGVHKHRNKEHFFNVNDLKRYSLGTKNKALQYAADGSLTIYLQHDKPADNLVSNWLPSPDGDFATTIRAYWPDESILKGNWLPPVVEKMK